jgi:MbtH protein
MSDLKVEALDQQRRRFKVVLNQEEQFSIWPVARGVPAGWKEEGYVGSEEACLQYIDQIWINMVPLSLRS